MAQSFIMDLAHIVLAINLSAPNMSPKTTHYYAQKIQKESVRKSIDPLLLISIIDHESRWNAGRISRDGLDFGLCQIRKQFTKQSAPFLLEGGTNISVCTSFLDSAREFCTGFLDREPETEEFLSCFQGSCGRVQNRCKPSKLTFRVIAYRQCLQQCLIEGVSRDCEELFVVLPRR